MRLFGKIFVVAFILLASIKVYAEPFNIKPETTPPSEEGPLGFEEIPPVTSRDIDPPAAPTVEKDFNKQQEAKAGGGFDIPPMAGNNPQPPQAQEMGPFPPSMEEKDPAKQQEAQADMGTGADTPTGTFRAPPQQPLAMMDEIKPMELPPGTTEDMAREINPDEAQQAKGFVPEKGSIDYNNPGGETAGIM